MIRFDFRRLGAGQVNTHLSLTHHVAAPPRPSFPPREREFGESILAVERVDGDLCRTGSDLDDIAAFLFIG